jgi:hypothetical protein
LLGATHENHSVILYDVKYKYDFVGMGSRKSPLLKGPTGRQCEIWIICRKGEFYSCGNEHKFIYTFIR